MFLFAKLINARRLIIGLAMAVIPKPINELLGILKKIRSKKTPLLCYITLHFK
jgi:hypothetical protein